MRTSIPRALLLLALTVGVGALPLLSAQTPPKPAPPPAKKPNKLTSVVKKLADTAATSAAGMAVDSVLGQKGRSVANALTGNTAATCPAGTVAVPTDPTAAAALAQAGAAGGVTKSAGAAVVNAAKKAAKGTKAAADPVAAAATAAGVPGLASGVNCQPVGTAGMTAAQVAAMQNAAGANAAAAAAAAAGGTPGGMPGGVGALAAVTPVGMAVAAAPLAGQAVKGLKGMFGGKPMDKIAILRELGKGHLELKGVKFIEGTAELEPGFEPVFAALGEALPLAEGTYILHVAAEQAEKGQEPDTVLARKRIEKAWAALLVNGVPDQRVIAVGVLPPEMQQGRKPPKRGEAKIEFIRLPKQP